MGGFLLSIILLWTPVLLFLRIRINHYPPLSQAKFAVNVIACNRHFQLDLLLQSLAHAAGTKYHDEVAVYVSVDCVDVVTIDVAKKWERGRQRLRVVYVESYQMPSNKQPKRLDERVARHWISSNNRLFSMGYDNVIYLESDHIVAPDFFEAADKLMDYADDHFPDMFMLNLGHHGKYDPTATPKNELSIFPLQNIGVIYRRHGWEAFISVVEKFCSAFGDWDHNLHSLLERRQIPGFKSQSLGFDYPRVRHSTTCYTSRRKHVSSNVNGCEVPNKLHQQEYDKFVDKSSRVALRSPLVFTGKVSHKHGGTLKANADMETRELCMEASEQSYIYT